MITFIYFFFAVLSITACLWCVKGNHDHGLSTICKVLAGAGIAVTLFSEYFFYKCEYHSLATNILPFLIFIALPLSIFIAYYFHPSWFRPVAIGSFCLLIYLFVANTLIWDVGISALPIIGRLITTVQDMLANPLLWLIIAQFALCIPLVVEHKRNHHP